MKITGDVVFEIGADYSNVTEISGSLYCSGADTKAAFPVLTSVGGSLDCSGADTKAAFPVLTSVGGSLYCSGADTKAAFPVLTSVGGSLDCSGADTKAAFPEKLKFNDDSAVSKCASALMASFLSVGILFADGISSKIINQRKSGDVIIYSVIVVGKTDRSIVIERGGVFSHGATLAEAKASLIYKLSDRDTSRFNSWSLKTVVPLEDAIASYRAITGACEGGTRAFCESRQLKDEYTVKEIIDLTKGSFGSDAYEAFFLKVAA
ncbi:MAG TPA: hypothetical protein VK149_12110 [Sideroxyarcus sp.]|nr:hypothetical protein [Sideroxyarcus sp.]